MGFRFRKSIKLAPGVRLNVGKRGLGMSLGPRGASVSVSSRGVYGNVGLPGTGLSYRSKLSGGSPRSGPDREVTAAPGNAVLQLQSDGSVDIVDEAGNPLPAKYQKLARQNNQEQIQRWLEARCEHWNQGIGKILGLHHETPPPDRPLVFRAAPFPAPPPETPVLRKMGFFARLLPWRRRATREANAAAEAAHARYQREWEVLRSQHDAKEAERRERFEQAQGSDPEAMQELLAAELEGIEWPRETLVSYQVEPDGRAVLLDVDLPEIEDLPVDRASVAARGLKLSVKPRSETQRRKDYLTHVHAVGFRLTGLVFHTLPSVETVVCSGYSQRTDPATGRVDDEYHCVRGRQRRCTNDRICNRTPGLTWAHPPAF